MDERLMMDILASLRDAARTQAMFRLAEHFDDAMLLAASEYHEAAAAAEPGSTDDGQDPEAVRGPARKGLH